MPSPERHTDADAREHEQPINPVQQLEFELMKRASFNGFAGEQVVADLTAHADLWRGVVMDRGSAARGEHDEAINLIKLRDIERGQWNVDTLFVLTSGVNDTELVRIACQDWGADEVGYVTEPDLGISPHPPELTILRIWWG